MFKNRIVYLIVAVALLVTAAFVVQSAIATVKAESLSRGTRAAEAEAARWVAMGKYYTDLQGAEVARQAHRDLIVAARYTGLALEDYEVTGKKNSLPACITAEMAAELPANIGSNGWKALVTACSQ